MFKITKVIPVARPGKKLSFYIQYDFMMMISKVDTNPLNSFKSTAALITVFFYLILYGENPPQRITGAFIVLAL